MTFLQAALNGDRQHQRAPHTPELIARDVDAMAKLGVDAVHVHAFDADGRETLEGSACAAVITAVRSAQSKMPISLTTSASIIADPGHRLRIVELWTVLPDLVTANQGEEGIVELSEHLMLRGVGIEAGLLSYRDALKFAEWPRRHECRRVLIEPLDPDPQAAMDHAAEMERIIANAEVTLSQVHHGDGVASWAINRRALSLGHGIRTGLEDTPVLLDGSPAESNEQLIRAAIQLISERRSEGH